MQNLPAVLCLLAASGLSSVAASSPNESKASPAEIEKVLQFERDWCNAYLHGDVAWLQKHVVSDFTLTGSTGKTNSLADDVAEAKSGKVKYEVFENREMKPRLYGDTAVVTGWTKVKATVDGKPYETDVAFTDTLTRIAGEWYGVSGHVSKPK